MTPESNPLKQYFRRPELYIKLPSHPSTYAKGIIDWTENFELPVYPMTAIDEITSRTPDALFNGTAVVDIISSCIPAIKKPWDLHGTDLDAILIAIKIAANGDKMEIETVCPSCSTNTKYDVNLSSMLYNISPGDYETTLKLSDLEFKFRPLTYKEIQKINIAQFEFQKLFNNINDESNPASNDEKTARSKEALKSITELTMDALASSVEYIKTPTALVDSKKYIAEFMKNCDKKTFTSLRDHSGKLKENTEIKPLKMSCSNCKHEYSQQFTLNISDFFE
jgi:hypothetical protein